MEWITNPEIWISLLTLTLLEIILGIDNIIFIAILADKLPEKDQKKARNLGLGLALITRILLLLSINWIIGLTLPLFDISFLEIHLSPSGKDLILVIGGLFLMGKAAFEIREKLEGEEHDSNIGGASITLSRVVIQILILDIIFSLDSVITAVGMANEVGVMIAAVIIAIFIMLLMLDKISQYVSNHPSIKMLALAFLLLIGYSLVAEGFHQHVSKDVIYFSMAFSTGVTLLNIEMNKKNKTKPVELHHTPNLHREDEK